jgi:hypothetical protein
MNSIWLTFAINEACIDSTIILCALCDDVGFIPVNRRLVIANTPNLKGSASVIDHQKLL